jgi:LPXTG-motif cell wall-anchored protein
VNLLKHARSATLGALLGLVGMATFATPALACHPEIDKVSSCVNKADHTWTVTWQVENSERNLEGTVTKVTTNGSGMTGIVVGAKIPANGTLTGVQTLPDSVNTARFSVTAEWFFNGRTSFAKRSGRISQPREECEPNTPPTTTSPTPSTSPSQSPSPSPSASPSQSTSPSPSASVSTSTSASPSPSVPSSATPSPSESVPVTEPQFIYDATCDTLTVGVEVPADWPADLTVTFTPSTGEPQTVVAKPGETKTVDFPASEGLEVTATPVGFEDEGATISYTTPADCDSSGGGGGDDGDGDLPLTGSAVSAYAGGAGLLLIIGAVVFLLARRRKVKFTA